MLGTGAGGRRWLEGCVLGKGVWGEEVQEACSEDSTTVLEPCWGPPACCSGGGCVDVSPGTDGRRSLNLASVPFPQPGPRERACLPFLGGCPTWP